MKPLFLLLGIGAIVALTQGCAHAERAATADSKVVVTIEGESRHVGRVLAALPVQPAPTEAPKHEAGTMRGDDVSPDDHADDGEDDDWSDEDADVGDDDTGDDDMGDDDADMGDDAADDDADCDGHRSPSGRGSAAAGRSITAHRGAGRWSDRGAPRARWD